MGEVPGARLLVERCTAAGLRVATAESCTGGMIAAAITDIAGSSAMFDRGFVTYSNDAKTDLLGVPAALIEQVGAVSSEVVEAMVAGALARSPADMAVAVTGIAGPGGGSADKPVGLVFIAAQRRGAPARVRENRYGDIDRAGIRAATVTDALALLDALI